MNQWYLPIKLLRRFSDFIRGYAIVLAHCRNTENAVIVSLIVSFGEGKRVQPAKTTYHMNKTLLSLLCIPPQSLLL